MAKDEFILFLAGEDSGDIIGESAVQAVREHGFKARGIGGCRMANAGLETLTSFEKFPVSGFFDVLPKAMFFRQILKQLKHELSKKECKGLCAIDYPGLNMKLCATAKKLEKPAIYLEPPQIFAWKAHRAKKLKDTALGVFFPFEQEAYAQFGVSTQMVMHPFLEQRKSTRNLAASNRFLLLPGSRKGVLKRNLPLYIQTARLLAEYGMEPVFIAARNELYPMLQSTGFKAMIAGNSKERYDIYKTASAVIAPPGTSLFEAACSSTFAIAAMRPDALTYTLARTFLKVKHLALPNLLLKKQAFPEFIAKPFESNAQLARKIVESILANCISQNAATALLEFERALNPLKNAPTVKKYVESWVCIVKKS